MPRHYRRKSSSNKRIEHDPNTQRINKVLASAGLGSRRDVEELVVQGRVDVDGQTITDLATRVDPRVCKIQVDGVQLKRTQLVYYALNKPKGILSTNNDPSGRARVIDFVPNRHRVFSVGRLDRHSEGLMLLTNDGDIAQRLAHPKFRVPKTYFVVVAGLLTNEELAKLKKGVYLAEGMARIDGARIRKTRKTFTELEILLSEGKNREIRRILARAGHKVVLLRRIAIGPLRLAELPVGSVRELTPQEVKSLYNCTSPKPLSSKSAKSKKPQGSTSSTAAQPTAVEKIVTPLAENELDDFGLGLDQDYQYDDSVLTPSDDAIEFGASDEEDWDDDFVSDYESLRSGSVLGYDDNQDESTSLADPEQPFRSRNSKPQSKQSRGPNREKRRLTPRTSDEDRKPVRKKRTAGVRGTADDRAAGAQMGARNSKTRSGRATDGTLTGRKSSNRSTGKPVGKPGSKPNSKPRNGLSNKKPGRNQKPRG